MVSYDSPYVLLGIDEYFSCHSDILSYYYMVYILGTYISKVQIELATYSYMIRNKCMIEIFECKNLQNKQETTIVKYFKIRFNCEPFLN